MNKIYTAILFLFFFQLLYCQSTNSWNSVYISPDKISKSYFNKNYLKNNIDIPRKYRNLAEDNSFFGGVNFKFIKCIDIDKLLSHNDFYVYLPKKSYIIVEFSKELRDITNSDDLVIESCKERCSCGKTKQDSALVLVAGNNRNFIPLGLIRSNEIKSYDFDSLGIKHSVKYVKIVGLSSSMYPYGFELMNIYGFKENPKDSAMIVNIGTPKTIEEIIYTIPDIFFDLNSSSIRSGHHYVIDSVSNLIKTKACKSIIISGYTDALGDSINNLELSYRRAEAVAQSLKECGIENNIINVIGFGENKLLPNIDIFDPRNRRVEIVLIFE